MRTFVITVSLIAVVAACGAIASGQLAQPAQVRQIDIYECPAHPDILATWPARCPTCGAQLQALPPSPEAGAGTLFVADTNYYAGQAYPPYPPNPPYTGQAYPSYSPSYPYGASGYPPAPQYGGQGYPPTTQYGGQGYPPTTQYGGQGYPPYSPSYPYGTQGYPAAPQYGGQGYPSYSPTYPYGSPGYPSYPPYGYGQGEYAYPPAPYIPAEPNNPYANILEQLNRLLNRNR
jgi:hypothetical protein